MLFLFMCNTKCSLQLIKQSQDDGGEEVSWKTTPVNERLQAVSKKMPEIIKVLAESSKLNSLYIRQCSQAKVFSCWSSLVLIAFCLNSRGMFTFADYTRSHWQGWNMALFTNKEFCWTTFNMCKQDGSEKGQSLSGSRWQRKSNWGDQWLLCQSAKSFSNSTFSAG